jgi:hypothetical protein
MVSETKGTPLVVMVMMLSIFCPGSGVANCVVSAVLVKFRRGSIMGEQVLEENTAGEVSLQRLWTYAEVEEWGLVSSVYPFLDDPSL